MPRKAKIKPGFLGKCHICSKEIWRQEGGWVAEEYGGIYIRYLCHTANPKTDCLQKHWDQETKMVIENKESDNRQPTLS